MSEFDDLKSQIAAQTRMQSRIALGNAITLVGMLLFIGGCLLLLILV